MQNIFVKMIITMNKRIFATTIGIALCVMYLAGTMSTVTGLHESTQRVGDMFEPGFLVVYNGYTLSESQIDIDTVEEIPGRYAACIIVVANVSGTETRVLAIKDQHDLLGVKNITLIDEVLPGSGFNVGNLTKLDMTTEHTSLSMNITSKYRPYTSPVFSHNWILALEETVRTLDPEMENKYSFLVVPSENEEALKLFEERGYHIMNSASIVEFFEYGFYQVEGNLWGVVICSTIIIIILVYNIMRIETEYRVPDIKIIKYLGASPRTVLYLFLIQALFISGIGAVLGLAMGIIAANAIVSLTQLFGFSSVLIPQVTSSVIFLPIGMGLISGLIGGFLPAYKASKTTIRTSREVL